MAGVLITARTRFAEIHGVTRHLSCLQAADIDRQELTKLPRQYLLLSSNFGDTLNNSLSKWKQMDFAITTEIFLGVCFISLHHQSQYFL